MKSLTPKIITFLEQHHIDFIRKDHAPTPTSQDSARERGEPLKIGAKALLVKADEEFILLVIPADRKLDTKKVKSVLKTKNLRFATKEELLEKTELIPGAVPPFGNLIGINMIVDSALFEEEFMAFNAGSLTTSIKMKTQDYKKIVQPKIDSISILEN
ncbi:hypothetical protein HYV86_02185 [Candidatus Woesearchaeota archaeon]|nr:hypothetical protein [Candidatus Woesearchaeota archaeon]